MLANVIGHLWRQLALRQRAKADEAIRKLREDVQALEIGPVPGAVRVALRTRYATSLASWLILIPIGYFEARIIGEFLRSLAQMYTSPRIYNEIYKTPSLARTGENWAQQARDYIFVPLFIVALRRTAVALGVNFKSLRAPLFWRIGIFSDLIGACANLARAPRISENLLTGISHKLRYAVLAVYGARSMRGTSQSTSRRRHPLRLHAAQVVATLRSAESGLDVDPRKAAKELGRLALKISDQYAKGNVGALLEDQDLVAVDMDRKYEALRLSTAAVIVAGIATGGRFLHAPAPVTVAAAIVVLAIVYRSVAGAGLAIVALLLPLITSK